MRTTTRRNLIIGIFCLVLCAANWEWSYDYGRNEGLKASETKLTGFSVLLTLVCAYGAVRTVWREIRACLDQGIRIPVTLKLVSGWGYLILLLPLLMGYRHVEHYQLVDGTNVQYTLSYGGAASFFVFLFGAVTVIQVNMLWIIDDYLLIRPSWLLTDATDETDRSIRNRKLAPGAGHA